MTIRSAALGKFVYGALFTALLPVLLILWAGATADVVPLPVIHPRWIGAVALGAGFVLLAAGITTLWIRGGGPPMNAYPPPRYVAHGIYRLLAHPIYVGFTLTCLGVAIAAASASGTWLVTPAVALGCAALILGHERHDLRQRFGAAVQRPLLALPPATDGPPTAWDRAAVVVLVFLPWSVVFEAVYALGIPPDAVEAYLPFERSWPVREWTEAVYGSVYLFVPAALFVAARRRDLRRFAVQGLVATAAVTLVYLTVPLVAPPRPFTPETALGQMLQVERAMANTVAAFPAFHVIWSILAAEAWASRSRAAGVVGWGWASLIAVSCLTTGMHAVVDILAAVAVVLVLSRSRAIWGWLRTSGERIANSWHAWRIGPVRIINYGAYAGLGGAVAFTVAAGVVGPAAFWQIVAVYIAGLLGAGLWAQTLEGSPKLSRPFGYYGSVLGAVAGTLVAGWLGGNTMLLLGAIALGAPWLQATGRLRCLVQGCCHGSPAPEAVGIRYWGERSRVCAIGDLRGVPLHPTPLYSLLANVVIGVLLARLWSLGATLSVIAGGYLILAGVSRFVEESYRGEPQTPILGGLRLYQWLAVLSVVAGALLTTVPSGAAPGRWPAFDLRIVVSAVLYGLLCWFAMGVDVPGSTRRFARLAPP